MQPTSWITEDMKGKNDQFQKIGSPGSYYGGNTGEKGEEMAMSASRGENTLDGRKHGNGERRRGCAGDKKRIISPTTMVVLHYEWIPYRIRENMDGQQEADRILQGFVEGTFILKSHEVKPFGRPFISGRPVKCIRYL